MAKSSNHQKSTTFGINHDVLKVMHYFMLFIMLNITFVAPAQGIILAYKQSFSQQPQSTYLNQNSSPSNNSAENLDQRLYQKSTNSILNSKPVFTGLSASNLYDENTIIESDLKEGTIGVSKSVPFDNPSDNLFKFNINKLPDGQTKIVLTYDLYGVENQNCVARSINNRYSTGGHLVKLNNSWTTQTEEISLDWLTIGENTVLFTTPKASDFSYKIKNIKLEFLKSNFSNLLVVPKTAIQFSKNNTIYIKGFVRKSADKDLTIEVEGTTLPHNEGEFEGLVELTQEIKNRKFVIVRAYDSKGFLGQELISLGDNLTQGDALYTIENKKTFDKVFVNALKKSTVAIEGASITIIDSALTQDKEISISKLRNIDFAPLGSDLTNVTNKGIAYRFLPDGITFEKPVPITIAYDPKLLPFGYTAKDIKTYYFDTKTKSWQSVPVLSIDEKNYTITALTTHFTDYVNGIIKVPESPETNAYSPTSMSGIKIANPSEKINLIQPPTANQEGDANLSYPIEIPAGRNGMQPNLSVNYNSSGGNGWMGLGWNITTPSIELDTRWGSPTFDSYKETEIYTFEGEQLLLKTTNGFYLPNKGDNSTLPNRIIDAMFYERVEGSFNKIQRLGSTPSSYSWTITDKSGTIYTYGNTITSTDAVLKDNSQNIVRWMLKKVQDVNGNFMEYFYTTKSFTETTVAGGKQIYLDRIVYTKHASLASAYSVVFNRATAVPSNSGTFTREDKSINARLGFKEITDDVLESIDVKYITPNQTITLVRKYKFVYKQGQFKKTLLDKIKQYDGANNLFNEHKMEYYDYTIDDGGKPMFGNEESISGLANDGGDLQGLNSTTLGASHTTSYNAGVGATAGYMNTLLFFETLIPISQSGTGGVNGGISGSTSSGRITFLDVDGDGLPDKLFKSGSLGYRKNLGNNTFDSPRSIPSMDQITESESFSKFLGIRANFTSGVFAGAERTWTNSYTNSYLEDVNGDGLIDVVKDRKVYFNTLNASALPTFTTLSSNSPNVIYQGLTTAPSETVLPTPVVNNFPFDVVKVWQAPYNGTIAITGTVSIATTPVIPSDGVYFSIEKGNMAGDITTTNPTYSTNENAPVSGFPVTLNATLPSKNLSTTLTVIRGERIYFRANTIVNDKDDLINFNTSQISLNYTTPISTVGTMPNTEQVNADQLSLVNSNATDGFIVSADQKISLPKNGTYEVSYPSFSINNPFYNGTTTPLPVPELSDEVNLVIEKHTITIVTNPSDNSVVSNDTFIYINTTPPTSNVNPYRIKINSLNNVPNFSVTDIVSNIDTDNTDNTTTQVYYLFKIESSSNVDWKKIGDLWKPKVVMPIPNSLVAGSTTTDVYPVAILSIYNQKIITTDASVVNATLIDKFANYIIPPAMNITGTTRKIYQMQPIFPLVTVGSTKYNNFGTCTTCTSTSEIRKLYLTVKGTNKNLLFHNTSAITNALPTIANQPSFIAKYEISIDYNGNILPTPATGTPTTPSGIKRFNIATGLYDIPIFGTTSTNVTNPIPQSTIINVVFDAINSPTTPASQTKNHKIYFEYFSQDQVIANALANVPFGASRIRAGATTAWTYANNLATTAIYPNIFHKKGNNIFGSDYRNWGQFAYKTEKSGPDTLRIRESELIPNAPLTSAQQSAAQTAITACGSASPPRTDAAYQACLEDALYPSATNPLKRIVQMIPDITFTSGVYNKRWKGTQDKMFVAETQMSPKNKYDETTDSPIIPTPTITATSEAFGIVKKTKSTSNSITVGAGVGAFTNFGDNKVLNDHRDINGDNYPDFITENSFQLTNKLGNLFPTITTQGYRQDSNGTGCGTTVAGSIPRFNYIPKGSNGTTTNQSSNTGSGRDIGFNGSVSATKDESKNILLDINGDGLTDKVDANGVNLNIGGTSSIFEGTTNWGYGNVQKGTTGSIASGVGVSLFSNSVSLGIGIGTSTSPSPTPTLPPLCPTGASETFFDINSDGLVDKIEGSTVRYNLGTTFDNTPTSINNFDKSYQSISANASINAGFTACFYFPIPVPLIPPFIFYLTGPKFCACGDGSLGYGINSESLQMSDVNGDGFVDIVSSNNENELKVRYSKIGRTNMLKKVTRPLGATITMDYAITNIDGSKNGNTYKMPFSKWAMTKVVVYDGHTGDGRDTITTKFEYFEGLQDRRERTFLGFGIVKTHNIDIDNNVYRTSVSEYATANPNTDLYVGALDNRIRQYFYKKGIVTRAFTLDGLGRQRSETVYTYKYYNPGIPTPTTSVADYNTTTTPIIPNPTTTFNAASFTDNSRVLPLLVRTDSKVSEFDSETAGATSHPKMQITTVDLYDKYGNVKQFQDKGPNLADIADDIKVNMLYFYNANNVVNVPMEHRVTNSGVVFRLSRNFVNTLGQIIQIRKYLTASLTTNYALYDIEYDAFGNIQKIMHPKGALSDPNSSRMSYTYTYDAGTKSYVTNVVDTYGYTSSTNYIFEFGVPKKTTDANNKIIEYKYDTFGRPTEVKGPYQSTWTIKNEYFPDLATPVALTSHFDDGGEIYTSTFIDGFQRVIQTKKELQNCICDIQNTNAYRLSVSGKVQYDEFGRVTESYLNNEEQQCNGTLTNVLKQFAVFSDNPSARTTTAYDYLDRPLSTTVYGMSAGDATTEMSYTFGADRYGVTQFMKQITLPNGNISRIFTDSKGQTTSSNQIGNGATYWTSFQYNKLSELLNIRDANEAVTYYTYDNFGRKTTINHPDAGMSTFKYDLASRLKESTNANLLEAGQKVLYKYNINQLTSVTFPSHTVRYNYGAVGAPDNGVGRLIYQSDLTGEQYFKYGSLGEVTENKRIVIDPLGAPRYFTTQFEYDTWGRIRKLTYPDGERVSHTYDKGGLIAHIENSDGQVYLDNICYDIFEKRKQVKYGNGTVSNYTYEPQQALQQMQVSAPNYQSFISSNYEYDLNSNIIQISNEAPPIANNQLGGVETKTFQYDEFNRLKHSEGSWQGDSENHIFALDMEYNSLHNILSKVQSHQVQTAGSGNYVDTPNSMNNYYNYTGGNQPHAVSTIDVYNPVTGMQSEQINNTYDSNGNLKIVAQDNLETGTSTARTHYWDEQNRLQAIVENETVHHYVYDASGERILKSVGSGSYLIINGKQTTSLNTPGEYTMYPSGYLVLGQHDYTKHYYTGSQRIASRMGDLATVNNFEGSLSQKNENNITETVKQNASLEAKKAALRKQIFSIFEKAKLGKPSFKRIEPAALIDPAEVSCEEEYNALLQYWSQFSNIAGDRQCLVFLMNTYQQTNSYCQTMEIIERGIKCFIETKKEPIWWYHPDHLGSSSYLSDYSGFPSHYYNYLPFGEEMVSQNTSSYNNKYRFSGKELDEETGLSYFGARYYNPKWSIWLGVDPLAEKYSNVSPYTYCLNNPINAIDPDGMRPIPLFDKFKSWFWKIDSYFGKRDTGLVGASKFHQGLDFNYSGGGDTDYGAPILTTHDGIVTVADSNPDKGEGRMIIVTSEGNEFRTRYFHLSKVEVAEGDKVSESDKIGEMGGSAYGKEKGRQVHLHYEIQKKDKDGKWESIDATEGKGKSPKNVVDPQKWIIKKETKQAEPDKEKN